MHFQIYSSEGYFIDLTSHFKSDKIVKKSNNGKPSAAKGLSYGNCVLHNLFMPISININATLVSTSNNFSNYASYIQFMLMTPMFYKILRCSVIGYEYKRNTDTSNILRGLTTKDLGSAGKNSFKLDLAFVESANALGSGTNTTYKCEMFGLPYLVCKVNEIPLYNLFFDKSYKTLHEFTMRSLDQDTQLFENGIKQFVVTNCVVRSDPAQ